MRSCFAAAAVVVLAMACGPKKGPDGSGGGGGGSSVGSGSAIGSGSDSGSGHAAAPVTRAECEKMIDHVLAIGMEEQRKTKPPEYVPTEEQVAKIRAKLVADQMEACLAWSHAQWDCVMAASTVEALYACAQGE